MKQESNNNKRWFIQFVVMILLIAIPIIMIVINGSNAIQGVLWEDKNSYPKNKTELVETDESNIIFGIYDPQQTFLSSPVFQLEHIYISWAAFDSLNLNNYIKSIVTRKRIPILTIEPWPFGDDNSLEEIIRGKYDSVMNTLCHIITPNTDSIYISWGHEMDQTLTKRYPWSGKNPDNFIKAYKYVHDYITRHSNSHIKWIWSPVVKDKFQEYWPGPEYVDIIGLPIYSFPQWDKSYYGYIRSFSKTFEEKYSKIKSFNKDVYIVELGVTGSNDFQQFWLSSAFDDFQNFSLLKGVVFFYSKDTPGAWGDISTPDWRSHPQVVEGLIEWYKQGDIIKKQP